MGDPLQHSVSSVKKFGGTINDYLWLHTVMDSSKLFLADWRHRALLHNTFGIHVFEQLVGPTFSRSSDNKDVCTRTVVSEHILEDLKAIPTPGEFLRGMPISPWMAGITPADKSRMQTVTLEGNGSHEAYVKSFIHWQLVSNALPKTNGLYLLALDSNVQQDSAIVARFEVSTSNWYNLEGGLMTKENILYWAPMPRRPSDTH